jgi:hypothetical protein
MPARCALQPVSQLAALRPHHVIHSRIPAYQPMPQNTPAIIMMIEPARPGAFHQIMPAV